MTIESIYQLVSSYKVQAIDIPCLFEHAPKKFIDVEFPKLSAFNSIPALSARKIRKFLFLSNKIL